MAAVSNINFYMGVKMKYPYLYVLTGIFLIFLGGFIIQYLWLWYIVPLGMMPIGVIHAIGLDIFVTYIMPGKRPAEKGKEWSSLGNAFITAIAFSLLGYVFHFFM